MGSATRQPTVQDRRRELSHVLGRLSGLLQKVPSQARGTWPGRDRQWNAPGEGSTPVDEESPSSAAPEGILPPTLITSIDRAAGRVPARA